MRIILASAAAALCSTLALTAAAPWAHAQIAEVSAEDGYQPSPSAMATAVFEADGSRRGADAYEIPFDAVTDGNMAAFLELVARDDVSWGEGAELDGLLLGIDRIAARDYDGAREWLETARGSVTGDPVVEFVEAWVLALEGDIDAAISAHRSADGALPGLTADLSLAAMLEAAGRTDEALAVYQALTPTRIEPPRHQFDARGIMFAHDQLVIARRTLLLRRLGRIEEAQQVYRQLADAEPEQAARYEAAMESLETGRGLDDEALDMEAAFARSFSDLSLSIWYRTIIQRAMLGQRSRGIDEQRATFDQLALLVDPGNEDLREGVIDLLQEEAFYEAAAHVAQSAPEPTAALQIAAAQSWIWARNEDAARAAVAQALELADEDEELGVLIGGAGLHALMGDEEISVDLATRALETADNDAERASTNGLKADILRQFGRVEEAVGFARAAREIDNTHERRMALANLLGDAGQVEEGLQIIRRERLRRPNDPYMLNTLGYFLIENTDNYEEGYQVLYRANSLARNDPYIADSLGWAYFRLGHLEDARRLIEQSRRELEPQRHWEIEHHLGDIYWYLGMQAEAREAWRTALSEFPPYHVEQEIEEKLENGLTEPAPEERPVPRVSIDDGETVQRKT